MEKTIQIMHSSGGGVGILVTTNVGASVSVSCEGQDTQTLTATDGTALFEDLAFGTWTVSVSLGGATTTETVEIYENIPCNLPVSVRLKDMPIGSKIRLGSGNTPFEIVAKNHSGYPDNSVTLWTPYSLQVTQFNTTSNTAASIDYRNSIPKTLCSNLYNTFSEREKEFVLLTDLPTKVSKDGNVVTLQDYLFLFSGTEFGGTSDYGADTGCTSFNFTNEQKNARCKDVNGSWVGGPSTYGRTWLRSAYTSSSYFVVVYWDSDDYFYFDDADSSFGFAPACNLSGETIISSNPDESGYYYVK